ncbi:MAG: carboxypeptidase regulatory-like domain-containing protein [Acidimicrobiia bacterium]|nr:carboxypeptidase regulatory-like domain-containing protein [Acidimicrobiia bacterium]
MRRSTAMHVRRPTAAPMRRPTTEHVRRTAAVLVLAALSAALLVACTAKHGYDFPPPPSTTPGEESTTVPDFSSVQLARVSGRTTTTVDNSPGQAHIAGFVLAPQGAVPGATVHVERIVEDTVLALDVATNPDGSFHVDNVKGGIYRVRAWRVPDLALTTPVIFYLGGSENKVGVNLQVTQYTGTNVTPAIAPSPPIVGDPANLAVQVTTVGVDPTGVVRATPTIGVQVDLQGSGSWQLQSPGTEFTDASGTAIWRLSCTDTGSQPLSASINGTSYSLNLPPCQESPPTFPVSPSTTSFPQATTTTG